MLKGAPPPNKRAVGDKHHVSLKVGTYYKKIWQTIVWFSSMFHIKWKPSMEMYENFCTTKIFCCL